MLQDEMTRSASWIQAHVSDHCGYHYRAMLLRRKLNLSSGHNAVYTEQASPSYSSFPGQADPVNNVREGEVQCHLCVTLENIPPKVIRCCYCCCYCLLTPPCLLEGVRFCCFMGFRRQSSSRAATPEGFPRKSRADSVVCICGQLQGCCVVCS